MSRSIRLLLTSLGVLILCGVLAACVWLANEWIASTLATMTILSWLALWLVVVYRRERVRALAAGALVAAGAYWLLAVGPWFNTHVGQTLLTSRLLASISAPTAQAVPQPAIYSYPVSYTTGLPVQSGDLLLSGSGIVTTSPQVGWGYISPPLAFPSAPPFRKIAGQWAFTWLFGLCGGGFAWLLTGRSARPKSQDSPQARVPGESKS